MTTPTPQFEAATPVVTSLPIPGVQRTGVVGIATCLTCGALVMTSSGEAIDLHHAWHAEQSRMAQPAASLSTPPAQERAHHGLCVTVCPPDCPCWCHMESPNL